ncbi:SHOCT domain-containing protein [Agrococcus sp. 1P02AA]
MTTATGELFEFLGRLAALRAEGILTEEEFVAAKCRLLVI